MNEKITALPFDRLGLKPAFHGELLGDHGGRLPWRVASVERGLSWLLGFDDSLAVIHRRARCPEVDLAAGDWVVLDELAQDLPRVQAVLKRATCLRRGAAGDQSREQLLAANLDTVFVVSAFAETSKLQRRSINARRIERYVAAVRDGGALPVIVLTKVDLSASDADELGDLRAELSSRLSGLEVLCVSALERSGLEPLRSYLAPGETVAFIGMSGVGKSSLINELLAEQRLRVEQVRGSDSKGRHTTTRRELVVMPTGALLIDTPGMRQFVVFSDEGEVAGFDDIDELARGCRFTDCGHDTEPDCAVRDAVARGELSADRLQNYRALLQEAERLRARHDSYARHLEHKAAKRFGRLCRQAMASKKR